MERGKADDNYSDHPSTGDGDDSWQDLRARASSDADEGQVSFVSATYNRSL